MSARDRGRRRVLTSDERVLWSAVTQSIAPLRGSSPPPEEESPEPPGEPIAPARPAPRAKTPQKMPTVQAPKPAPPPLAPLDRRMKKRVARGREPIDGRIDLHGLTQAEAHAALLRFLRAASGRDARLVLVITGKGRDSDGGRGVLRRQVPQWLGLPEFRALVVGFEDAHIAHGGEGALYVRVRRTKSV
ncbi:MAG TPA: Smr/MutS family protein [Pseudolabrys sp.]|nr:Smr/MutS family protein [Pseudolabrys sp.]